MANHLVLRRLRALCLTSIAAVLCAPSAAFGAATCNFSGETWDRPGCVIIYVTGGCDCDDISISSSGSISAQDSNGRNCYGGYVVTPWPCGDDEKQAYEKDDESLPEDWNVLAEELALDD